MNNLSLNGKKNPLFSKNLSNLDNAFLNYARLRNCKADMLYIRILRTQQSNQSYLQYLLHGKNVDYDIRVPYCENTIGDNQKESCPAFHRAALSILVVENQQLPEPETLITNIAESDISVTTQPSG